MHPRDQLREDVLASIAAHRELDPDFEPAIADSLADRLVEEVDTRVEQRLANRDHGRREAGRLDLTTAVVALGSICLALGVPSAMAQLGTALSSIISVTAWIAIVAINVVQVRARRPRA